MTVFEMAKKYYPKQWSEARIEALIDAGKLTREEADEVINSATSKAD
ncbi:MAG: XkdX family protein [Ruminococcus flavefaciens]|nr:XkdX family protein [Ruminococcus flavefaciens]